MKQNTPGNREYIYKDFQKAMYAYETLTKAEGVYLVSF